MESNPKSYPAPWDGQVILACRKCQNKLKGNRDLRSLAKLKKTAKRYNKKHPEQTLQVINVPCMDLCPKDGVTVCNPARNPYRLLIVRDAEDIGRLVNALDPASL
jgi:predicted metal-binding protein